MPGVWDCLVLIVIEVSILSEWIEEEIEVVRVCVCGLFLEEFIMHSHCMYCDGEGVSPNFCAISIVIAYYFVGKIRHL